MPEQPLLDGNDKEVPAPFSPGSPPRVGGGCGRAGLIGCGLLTLLLGAAAVVFILKAGDLFAWAMDRFEAEIVKNLPDDCTEEDRQRLRTAFAAASAAVQTGEADALALQRLQKRLRHSVLAQPGGLTRQQVLELIVALEEVAAVGEEESSDREEARAAPATLVLAGLSYP